MNKLPKFFLEPFGFNNHVVCNIRGETCKPSNWKKVESDRFQFYSTSSKDYNYAEQHAALSDVWLSHLPILTKASEAKK